MHCGGWLVAWNLAWRLLTGVASVVFFSCEDLLPIPMESTGDLCFPGVESVGCAERCPCTRTLKLRLDAGCRSPCYHSAPVR